MAKGTDAVKADKGDKAKTGKENKAHPAAKKGKHSIDRPWLKYRSPLDQALQEDY